jgi:hypothetical protein
LLDLPPLLLLLLSLLLSLLLLSLLLLSLLLCFAIGAGSLGAAFFTITKLREPLPSVALPLPLPLLLLSFFFTCPAFSSALVLALLLLRRAFLLSPRPGGALLLSSARPWFLLDSRLPTLLLPPLSRPPLLLPSTGVGFFLEDGSVFLLLLPSGAAFSPSRERCARLLSDAPSFPLGRSLLSSPEMVFSLMRE